MMNYSISVCIRNKDIQRIMGMSYRHSRLYLLKLRADLKKERHQFVSIGELADYAGLPIEEVIECMKPRRDR